MAGLKRLYNILRYGLGPAALERKRAAKGLAREARFASDRWSRAEGLARRNYADYDEYLEHQASKLGRISDRLDETVEEDLAEFRRRFETCQSLGGIRTVLCLGARIGTEVRAFHQLGRFAVGIDLNPGPDNRYVLPGDFHAVQFPDGSVDAVYTNCLDHVFDLERILAEIVRMLPDMGVFITDVLPGFEEGWTPGEYEASHWPTVDELAGRITRMSGLEELSRRDLGTHRRDPWIQIVFQKKPHEDRQAAAEND